MWIPPLCRHEQRAAALPPLRPVKDQRGRHRRGGGGAEQPFPHPSRPGAAFNQAIASKVSAHKVNAHLGMAVNSAISALPTACLPGPGAGAGALRSALDITDHVCSLGQLRLLLRRSRGFCGHRPHHRSDERGDRDRQAGVGRARWHPAAPCRRWWCRCTWPAAASTWQRLVRWLSATALRCWRMPATRSRRPIPRRAGR